MAVLGKIRQRSFVLIVVIALALFAFVLADVIQSGGFSQSSTNIGSINGKDISFEQFRFKVDALEKGGQTSSTMQAVNQIWNEELNIALFTEEFEKLGLRVGEDHVINIIKNDPQIGQNQMFLNEAGVFDINRFKEYIRSNPDDRRFVEGKEDQAKINAKYQIYSSLIRGGFYTTSFEGQQKYEAQNKKVSFDFVSLPFSSINDSEVTVSDKEISDFLKKNEKKYKVDETREIVYVVVEDKPSDADKNEIKERLNALLSARPKFNEETKQMDTLPGFRDTKDPIEFVNLNSDFPYDSTYVAYSDLPAAHADGLYNLQTGEVYGPYILGDYYAISRSMGKTPGAKARASHILISYDGSQAQAKEFRTKDEARARAEELLKEVNANPDNFANLARTNSDDTGSAQQGGDLDFFSPGMMVGPFNDFVFNNPVGKRGIVETDFGFHVIHITDKQDAIRLASVAQKIVASDATSEGAYTNAVRFEVAANDKSFEEAAKDADLTITDPLTFKALDEMVGPLGNQRQIVRWAFEKGTDVNDVKRFEVSNVGHVIAVLKKINKEGLMSVEAARASVEPILRNKKKAQMLIAKAKDKSIEEVASQNNAPIQKAVEVNLENPSLPGVGFEAKVVGAAFATEVNASSKPIEGNTGVYVVKPTAVVNAMPVSDYQAQINALKAQHAGAVGRVFNVLKDQAKIKDNRAKFNY